MDCTEHVEDRGLTLPCALPTDADLSPAAAAVRATLLHGLATKEAFSEGLAKCQRTIDTWIAQGLPTVRVGRQVFIPVGEAKAWLLKSSARNTAPRGRGRPRKAA